MQTMKAAAVAVLLLGALNAASSRADDQAMTNLASHSGCLTCHAITRPPAGAADTGAKPVGPSWQEVAAKYKGQKDAVDVLTATVMKGSNPYASHWKGKVSGLAMPPNAVAIGPQQARDLVTWILTLDSK